MRITSTMISNSSKTQINNTKVNVDKAYTSMISGKKIQVPSDDPIIAIRALKLRNNLNELNQYYERNIKDADSWMSTTEDALVGMRKAISQMYDQYMRGANDPLSTEDRAAVKNEIFALRGDIIDLCNTKAIGRSIFTGFKTSTDFTFKAVDTKASYSIEETFLGKDIESITYVSGIKDFQRTSVPGVPEDEMPQSNKVYRLSLGYQKIDSLDSFTYTDASVNPPQTVTVTVNSVPLDGTHTTSDKAYTDVNAGQANFIPETGELILSEDLYLKLADLKADANGVNPITLNYKKTGFDKGDARPEMYYNCKDLVGNITYTKEDQDIEYTVNFSQKLQVNTQIADYVGRDLIRNIDDLVNAIQRVDAAQEKVDEIKEMINSGRYTDSTSISLSKLQTHLESAQKELDLQQGILSDVMQKGVGQCQSYGEAIDVAKTDVGNRKSRMNLIEERLANQQTNFKELKSENEDKTESDAILDLSQAKVAYESALTATGQISQISLLNYL